MHPAKEGLVIRIWRLTKVDPETGCWLWQRRVYGNERPRMYSRGKQLMVHRFLFQVETNQRIKRFAYLASTCGNNVCINPEHHFLRNVTPERTEGEAP